jgi:general secretion pathway protein D
MRHSVATRVSASLLAAALLASCSGYRAARQADVAAQTGNWDEAVLYYLQAAQDDPENISHKAALLRAQMKASQMHFDKAKRFIEADVPERAMIELQQAVQLDPSNQYAQVELQKVRAQLRAIAEKRSPESTLAELKQKTKGSRPQPPVLNPRSKEPISLEFPEPTDVKLIYKALGKAFGINVLFDPQLKNTEVPIVLRDVTAQDALEIVMRAAGHFYKVVDEQTVIIAADTPQNRRNYEDQVIQAFFLSNAEVKDAMTTLRSLIGAKQLSMSEQLNAIILRDSADKVKVAEKIIETVDKAKAEVVIDVELLQLNTTKIRDLGMSLSADTITQSLDLGGTDIPLRLSDLGSLNQRNWTLTVPSFVYSLVKNNADAQLLAQPRLRITEGEKARLVIGDRVPIPVTSFNTANTVGGNIVPITSFQYQDVGITIQMEPRVHHNREVTLKMTVEVSQVSGNVTSGGQQQPIIGNRTIESTIRLKDGETNFLAGLIRSDSSEDDKGIPGLSELPVIGRLFSKNRTENRRTDVMLTITPHIVRLPDITEEDLMPIWVGTEANITFRGGSPRVESEIEGPFDDVDEGASPDEIRRRIQERLQRLPPGLREADPNAAPEPPPGQELVPGLQSPNPFLQPTQEPQEDEPPADEFPEPFPSPEPPASASLSAAGAVVGAAPGTESRAYAAAALEEAGAFASYARASDSPLGATAEVRLSLAASRPRVAEGETFEVTLDARSLGALSHLPVTLSYDPALLSVESVQAGSFLGGPEVAQVLSDASKPGRLVLGASRLGKAPGVAGSGVVARIVFKARSVGTAAIGFAKAQALDSALGPLEIETSPLALELVAGRETPRERETVPPVVP